MVYVGTVSQHAPEIDWNRLLLTIGTQDRTLDQQTKKQGAPKCQNPE